MSKSSGKLELFLERVKLNNQPGTKNTSIKESQSIGYFTYDFENNTETYTSLVNN